MSQTILLVIHILITAALIGVVLIQRSEGGGLGMGGGGGGMGPFMSVRGTANLLTRATTFLAACFIASSLMLAILARSGPETPSVIDDLSDPVGVDLSVDQAPASDAVGDPDAPATDDGPSVPAVPIGN